MNTLTISLIFSFFVFIIFLLNKILGKRTDYYLDYEENEAPDNIRYINKEVPIEVEKIVEKEVPVEVEKIVEKEVPYEVEKIIEKEVPVEDKKITSKLKTKIEDLDSIINKMESEMKDKKKELSTTIEDRDYFSNLIDKKEEQINNLKKKMEQMEKTISPVYQGIDDLGEFKDVYNLDETKYPKKLINKIQDINEQLETDQFAYYVINNLSKRESVQVNNIEQLDRYIKIMKQEKTKGKYDIYVILNNKVYHSVIH